MSSVNEQTTKRAKELLAQVRAVYETPGWKCLLEQWKREVVRAETNIYRIHIGRGVADVGGEFLYKKGFYDGLFQFDRMRDFLVDELESGRIPWENTDEEASG